jgi:hypothetical protein
LILARGFERAAFHFDVRTEPAPTIYLDEKLHLVVLSHTNVDKLRKSSGPGPDIAALPIS